MKTYPGQEFSTTRSTTFVMEKNAIAYIQLLEIVYSIYVVVVGVVVLNTLY